VEVRRAEHGEHGEHGLAWRAASTGVRWGRTSRRLDSETVVARGQAVVAVDRIDARVAGDLRSRRGRRLSPHISAEPFFAASLTIVMHTFVPNRSARSRLPTIAAQPGPTLSQSRSSARFIVASMAGTSRGSSPMAVALSGDIVQFL
jgi:hypothetical protein